MHFFGQWRPFVVGCTLTACELLFFQKSCQQTEVLLPGDTPYKSINKAYLFKRVLRSEADESSSFGL